MQPLRDVQKQYNEINEPDCLLVMEHTRRMGALIELAIREDRGDCTYTIHPIPGPYAPVMPEKMALTLISHARKLGYSCEMKKRNEDTFGIVLSGWKKQDMELQLKKLKREEQERRQKVSFEEPEPQEQEDDDEKDPIILAARRGDIRRKLAGRLLTAAGKHVDE